MGVLNYQRAREVLGDETAASLELINAMDEYIELSLMAIAFHRSNGGVRGLCGEIIIPFRDNAGTLKQIKVNTGKR